MSEHDSIFSTVKRKPSISLGSGPTVTFFQISKAGVYSVWDLIVLRPKKKKKKNSHVSSFITVTVPFIFAGFSGISSVELVKEDKDQTHDVAMTEVQAFNLTPNIKT